MHSIHTDENNAGRRLRDLQEEAGLDVDKINVGAGKPIISLEELSARDRSEGKIWSLVTGEIKKITIGYWVQSPIHQMAYIILK